MAGRRFRRRAVRQLIRLTEDPIHRGLRSQVITLISQAGDDLLGGAVAVLGAVDDLENLMPLSIGQLVGRGGLGTSPAVLANSSPFPSLYRPTIDAQGLAGLALPRASVDNFVDQAEDQIPLLVVVSSSSSPQISWAFFFSASGAATSARALSLRRSSFSSSVIRRDSGDFFARFFGPSAA